MPAERGYDQQTMPGAAAMLPGQDPRALGAGIGEAVAALGGQMHSDEIRAFQVQKKIDRDQQLAEWSHRFSAHKLNMDGISRETRSTAEPGGANHVERIRQTNEAARDGLFTGIEDPDVRRLAEQQWNEYSGGLISGEGDWAEGQRVAKVVMDTATSNDLSMNRIRRSSDPKVYGEELRGMLDRNALLNVDPATRQKLDREAIQGAGTAFIQNLQDTNPTMALGLLDSGEFDFLDPERKEVLRNGTMVEIRRREAAAEHQAATLKAQGTDQTEALKKRFNDGVEIPDADFDAAIKFWEAQGDMSQVAELQGMRADNQFAKVWSGASPLARQNRVNVLSGKKKRTEAEDRELKWLKDKRETLDARFREDPVGFASENAPAGTKPPPGDVFGDPGALRARVDWARQAGRAYGKPDFPILSKTEAETIGGLRESGTPGELQVLEWMDRLPDDFARQSVAKQIAPKDPTFQALALVRKRPRETIRRGAQALQANPQLLAVDKKVRGASDREQMFREMDADLIYALRGADPTLRATTPLLGQQFVAGLVSARGQTNGNGVSRGDYAMGQRVAMGGAVKNGRDVGGLGRWGDKPFVLPSEMVQRPDQQVPGVRSFELAVGQDMNARGIWPRNPDGSVTDWRYIHPVWLGVERGPRGEEVWLYRWEDAGGRVIQSNKGGDFISRIVNN